MLAVLWFGLCGSECRLTAPCLCHSKMLTAPPSGTGGVHYRNRWRSRFATCLTFGVWPTCGTDCRPTSCESHSTCLSHWDIRLGVPTEYLNICCCLIQDYASWARSQHVCSTPPPSPVQVVFTVDKACHLLGVGLCGTEGV